MGTIYILRNRINKKVYIGQTIQPVETRFKQHLKLLISSSKQRIYKAIKKYGKEHFYYEILEECSKELLDERETIYIDKFDSVKKGYNLCRGGIQSRKPALKLPTRDIIDMYNKGYSQREIAEKYKVSHKTIGNLLIKADVCSRKTNIKLTKFNKISEEVLKELITRNISTNEMGRILSVNGSAIRKALKRYNLQNIIVKN